MSLLPIMALAALLLWVVFVFILPVPFGAIHLLLGLGATLLVRWWALRGAEKVSRER
ncbi:MAG: hypothetical protein ACREMO_10585 [Gemmatimonadales bacterium]